MNISYKKLFHLLIDKEISETQFRKLANISAPTLTKLRKGETITTEIICKICNTLNCQPADIMEFIPNAHAQSSSAIPQGKSSLKKLGIKIEKGLIIHQDNDQ